MNVLDLFSGIGGFSLGLERAGFTTVAFCEIDPFCQAVLRKHWPDVPIYDDVTALTADGLAADGFWIDRNTYDEDESGCAVHDEERQRVQKHGCTIDLICGGFPCQDISVAGKGEGIEGSRSGLWKEYARIIGELRPRYVIVENVAALLNRGLERVLGDLAALGYDAEWHCIPASAVGAPHRRDRIWIVADAEGRTIGTGLCTDEPPQFGRGRSGDCCSSVADADSSNGHRRGGTLQVGWGWRTKEIADDGFTGRIQWLTEPDVGRVAHGIPARVDRLRSLGNAVVPQIPEIIGKAIMAREVGAPVGSFPISVS